MKKAFSIATILIAMTASAQTVNDSAWRADVHTALLYTDNPLMEQPMPVLRCGREGQRMTLEFDVLRPNSEQLRWHIAHCTATWQTDDLEPHEMLVGLEQGEVEHYEPSFTTRQDYVHYSTVLPDNYSTFIHSGNYVVYVVDEEAGDTLLSRRFVVSEQTAKIAIEQTRPYDGVAIDRKQEVDAFVESDQMGIMPQYLTVVAQQNGRTDNRRALQFSGYNGRKLCFRQRRENVFDGGNNFRFFDMSNLRAPMYNVLSVQEYGGELMAAIRPCENRSGQSHTSETALRGGMKVNAWDRTDPRTEAEYVWVNLSLPMAQPMMDGEIYVVGALTDWRLDSTSRMDYDMRRHAYSKRLLLKQGYYAYQLLFRRMHGEASTERLEGDHFETPNRYTVYVYQRMPSDRADRLIGVATADTFGND